MARELAWLSSLRCHDRDELEMALEIMRRSSASNNRNLKTLQIDLNATFTMRREIPADRIGCERSGIRTVTMSSGFEEPGWMQC